MIKGFFGVPFMKAKLSFILTVIFSLIFACSCSDVMSYALGQKTLPDQEEQQTSQEKKSSYTGTSTGAASGTNPSGGGNTQPQPEPEPEPEPFSFSNTQTTISLKKYGVNAINSSMGFNNVASVTFYYVSEEGSNSEDFPLGKAAITDFDDELTSGEVAATETFEIHNIPINYVFDYQIFISSQDNNEGDTAQTPLYVGGPLASVFCSGTYTNVSNWTMNYYQDDGILTIAYTSDTLFIEAKIDSDGDGSPDFSLSGIDLTRYYEVVNGTSFNFDMRQYLSVITDYHNFCASAFSSEVLRDLFYSDIDSETELTELQEDLFINYDDWNLTGTDPWHFELTGTFREGPYYYNDNGRYLGNTPGEASIYDIIDYDDEEFTDGVNNSGAISPLSYAPFECKGLPFKLTATTTDVAGTNVVYTIKYASTAEGEPTQAYSFTQNNLIIMSCLQ